MLLGRYRFGCLNMRKEAEMEEGCINQTDDTAFIYFTGIQECISGDYFDPFSVSISACIISICVC